MIQVDEWSLKLSEPPKTQGMTKHHMPFFGVSYAISNDNPFSHDLSSCAPSMRQNYQLTLFNHFQFNKHEVADNNLTTFDTMKRTALFLMRV